MYHSGTGVLRRGFGSNFGALFVVRCDRSHLTAHLRLPRHTLTACAICSGSVNEGSTRATLDAGAVQPCDLSWSMMSAREQGVASAGGEPATVLHRG